MSNQDIDNAILSAVGEDWTRAALIVGKTGYRLGVKYAAVATRMRVLIEQGILVWKGDDLGDGRSWIKALVRKSN